MAAPACIISDQQGGDCSHDLDPGEGLGDHHAVWNALRRPLMAAVTAYVNNLNVRRQFTRLMANRPAVRSLPKPNVSDDASKTVDVVF